MTKPTKYGISGIDLTGKEKLDDLNKLLFKQSEQLQQTYNLLLESEEKFRAAFRTIPDSINLNRIEDGMYVEINEGLTQLTRMPMPCRKIRKNALPPDATIIYRNLYTKNFSLKKSHTACIKRKSFPDVRSYRQNI